MSGIARLGLAAAAATLILGIVPMPRSALADENPPGDSSVVQSGDDSIVARARKSRSTPDRRSTDRFGRAPKPVKPQLTKVEWDKQVAAFRTKQVKIVAENRAKMEAYRSCLSLESANRCLPIKLTLRGPGAPPPAWEGAVEPIPAVGTYLPPETVAYEAVVRLRLKAPKALVGPPPKINPWKIAAVGYPLWLSVDGATDPAPVSQEAFGLQVALDAHLEKVVFDMGDGHTVTCRNFTKAWHRGVQPGTPSPACGYRYEKPSLPAKKYTVTARSFWAVDWRVNGSTGVIQLAQTSSVQLPVGELQVVLR